MAVNHAAMRGAAAPQNGHGGRRIGAGRKPNGARAGVSHLRRPELAWHRPAHVTLRVRRHVPSLRSRKALRRIWACFEKGAVTAEFRVVQYSIQGNHMHLICESASARALSRGMQGLAIRLARSLNKMMGRRRQPVFADRFHSQPIRTALQARNAMRYVLNNRRRHMRQFGKLAEPTYVDPFSSAWTSGAYAQALDPAYSPARLLGEEFRAPASDRQRSLLAFAARLASARLPNDRRTPRSRCDALSAPEHGNTRPVRQSTMTRSTEA